MPNETYQERLERERWEERVAERAHQARTVRRIVGGAGAAALALFALIAVLSSTFTVDQKELAVVTTNGAFSYVAEPGRHFKMPFFQATTFYHTGTQSLAFDNVEAYTVDNQPVTISGQVQFNIDDAAEVERLFKHFAGYQARMQSITIDRTKIAFGSRQVADIPSERGAIEHEVLDVVARETRRLYGLDVTEFQLLDLHYSEAFVQATNAMAVAKAQVQQAEQQRLQAQKTAERQVIEAQGQADANVAAARGTAQATIAQAQADAQATRLKGDAEAEAIRAQAGALGASPSYVALRQAERWNGQLPATILGGSAPLPILNVNH